MKKSSDTRRERRQSNKGRRTGWAFFRRRWFLKVLLALAPFLTKLVELAILILKHLK